MAAQAFVCLLVLFLLYFFSVRLSGDVTTTLGKTEQRSQPYSSPRDIKTVFVPVIRIISSLCQHRPLVRSTCAIYLYSLSIQRFTREWRDSVGAHNLEQQCRRRSGGRYTITDADYIKCRQTKVLGASSNGSRYRILCRLIDLSRPIIHDNAPLDKRAPVR